MDKMQEYFKGIESLFAEKERELERLKNERDHWRLKALTYEGKILRINEEKSEVTRRKLAMINSLNIMESEGSGGELYYVYADKTPECVDILKQLGVPDRDIDDMTCDDGALIDISHFGFQYAGAKWYSEDRGGFIDFVPDEAPEWCK